MMPNTHNSDDAADAEVVAAYRAGDKRLQQAWYERCRRSFATGTARYGGISDLDREDLFQDSFIVLWEKMESGQVYVDESGAVMRISPSGTVPVHGLMAYFMRIVRNKYLELFRSRNINVELDEAVTPAGGDIFAELYWDEDPEVVKDRIVTSCLMSMPHSCLDILTKFYYQKKTLEQILEERPENTSYDGLKSRKSKCLANLKKRISEQFAKAGLLDTL